ncbi:MAG: hypothetical protein P8O10_01540 [Pseudorhodobacter sp.]|nr:hypothetical protein [Pseudorhodobacter sp.]
MDFFAFFWTLPVNWAGFTTLPENADAAAKVSRTIHYQVEVVRRWVNENNGSLRREVVFMDVRPDRGTDAIQSEISTLLVEAQKTKADVVLVDFSEAFGWRPHGPLFEMIRDAKNCLLLPPESTLIDGKIWNPVDHFRAWREVDYAHQLAKDDIKHAAMSAVTDLKADGASYATIASRLNDMGMKTVNGRVWTADNVRKFMSHA